MPLDRSSPSRRFMISAVALAVTVAGVAITAVRAAPIEGELAAATDHLVLSEVMTGGVSASDEFVELYNPTASAQSLDGLELVYVTATGATITRKAVWGSGARVQPRGHLLVANEAGLFAGIADATYAGGLAAAGGSMALRVIGASIALDAVGWGTTTSTWLETAAAPATPAGSSLERLPGGPLGSGQDTDHNLVDFVVHSPPDPQNSASAPVPVELPDSSPSDVPEPTASPTTTPSPSPSAEPTETPVVTPQATDTPSPTPSPTPTPVPTAEPTATLTPAPTPLTVAQARAMPDDASVVLSGTSLTSSDFHDGGGYVADATGGIAVLVEGGTLPRGLALVVAGTVDDRYAQRTVRVDIGDVALQGASPEPEPQPADTGAIGEAVEGRLIEISGVIQGSPTALASGLAFEVDDGSGPVRVLIGPATGIPTADWLTGTTVTLIGVVGQRDSSGTGADGYRVQPRDAADVTSVAPPPTPEPTPTPSVSPSPTASPSATVTPSAIPLMAIADARRAEPNARVRIRGLVTLPSGLVDEGSAVVQDATGAILIRAGSEMGRLRRGQLVELTGTRSTKSGMVSLRVSAAAMVLGTQAAPAPVRRTTGGIREADEAWLVVVRGIVRDGPRRTTGGGLTLTVNDGSGPVRVFVSPRTGITARNVPADAWVELRGVVGQQTTGAEPNAGYRLWPRDRADLTVMANANAAGAATRAGGSAARTTIPKPSPSPGAPVRLSHPILAASSASGQTGTTKPVGSVAAAPPVPRIPVPLAAGLGGLAGLLILAWRHGTFRRAMAELELRAPTIWRPASDGDEEDGPYTPAP